jgi:diguanylate cyclase (GGDEF)-like protein
MLHSRPRVLIADDSPTNRAVMRRVLDGENVEIVEVENGLEALKALESQDFAAVLLDLDMPGIDGFETIRRMRVLPRAVATPVIIVTAAFIDPSHRRLGYDLGAVDYLINKPIEPDVLLQKVRVFIQMYEKRLELQLLLGRITEENERLYVENEQFRSTTSELQFQATHDSLTGLPNRALLRDRLERAIQRARRSGRSLALAYLDLDSLKRINDRCGHAAGDELLTEVARRLVDAVRGSDTVARIGGDEFIVLMESLDDEVRASILGQKVIDAVRQPVTLHSCSDASATSVIPTMSLGLALFPRDASDEESLMMLADLAMYEAKRKGGDSVRVYQDVRVAEPDAAVVNTARAG